MCSKFCGDDVLLLPSPVKLIRNSAFYSDSLHFLPVRVHLRSSASAPCRFHSRSVQLSHLLCSSQIHSALRRAKHLAPPRAQGRASAPGQQGLDTSPPLQSYAFGVCGIVQSLCFLRADALMWPEPRCMIYYTTNSVTTANAAVIMTTEPPRSLPLHTVSSI